MREKHNFTAHLSAIKNKILLLYQGLREVTGPSWGLNKNIDYLVEKVILHGAAAWDLTSQYDNRLLSSIQRMILLSISGAYNTIPTAALQVIEGLVSLHIKAKHEATLVRVS
ncbi:hypothetical protein AVEN_191160-1 [Araneus ventricosus]|uniref:Uncharacterized protein n=1 Tax=Araneus ventricosus TaxID=182803 RepID=A0A4Y2B094_ARAVE|nr:hypothetical protein AVEN_191160-1 [Araneus ventricosus]